MSKRVTTLRIPFHQAGYQFGRDTEYLAPFALVDETSNVNFHEGGIGKRGGTDHFLASAITGNPAIRGLYQYKSTNGNKVVFSDATGKLYHTSESNVLKTGMSTSNYYSFSVFADELYIADGGSVPQVWDGSAASTSSISGIPTDWTGVGGYPFQIIPHARGANARNWAIRSDAVYASAADDGDDFSDANVIKIPVYSEGGLVGGFDFGGTLFVFSKTKTYLIDDVDSDTSKWGYSEAIWEGGASHWRLITKAGNNLYIMSDEGFIYSLAGIQGTGNYEQSNLTRPAYIDRWFREQVIRSDVEKFHSVFDRSLRCINYHVRVGGSNTNTVLKYFIDRPPELAFIIHENETSPSGFDASVSAEVQESIGTYKIYTGDFNGEIWKHEQSTFADDSADYKANVKLKPLNLENPRTYKLFKRGKIRAKATGNFELTIRVYIDGVRKNDILLSLAGTGAFFGTAVFDTSVFARDEIIPVDFELGHHGYDIQLEVLNENAGEDFFLSEMLIDFKVMGVR